PSELRKPSTYLVENSFEESLQLSINRSLRAEAQAQALSAIPTPSECSLVSFCTSDHESDSEEEIIYENVEPRDNCPSRESISEDSIQEPHNSFVDSSLESDRLSLSP
ncbi:unnamed protein product, partial [Porites lobata]